MDNIIICFAGPIGSGKTTVAKLVADTLGWSCASFGSYVRKMAHIFGYNESRENLQLIGEYLIDRGWRDFCEQVLFDANWEVGSNIIIEGIRHLEALETLKDIVSPANMYLIYVSLYESERADRLQLRDNKSCMDLESLELHSTENQVKTTLLDRADLVVDNSGSAHDTAEKVVAWILSLKELG